MQELPGTELINGYGQTESTTFTCCHPIERELSPSTRSIPIGQPISNTQVYLLDAHLQPVPLGVAGELYIGGDGLARGYLKRPELTAERFVPHPCSQRPGARLYKTGDLARYLPDGSLEFVGRLDHQVKLRGYRIELGEIEQALLHHPAVSECVVVVRQSQAGSKQLVAYVVAAQDQEAVEQAELRSFLGERLPEYMVPSHLMALEALPLTANGKVDRRALPAPEPLADTREPYAAPRTSIEQSLMEIWSQVLRLPNPHHWNQAFLLHAPAELSVARLEQAVQWVLGQHDVFRLRFVPPASPTEDWQASYVPTYEPVPFSLVDLRELSEEEQVSRLRDLCSQEQARLHLQSGPLARAVLFRLTGEQPWRLLLLSHHLVIDTVSWRILLEDLSQAYERLQQGLPLEPMAASSSFQQWAQRLQASVQSEAMQQEADFWLHQTCSG